MFDSFKTAPKQDYTVFIPEIEAYIAEVREAERQKKEEKVQFSLRQSGVRFSIADTGEKYSTYVGDEDLISRAVSHFSVFEDSASVKYAAAAKPRELTFVELLQKHMAEKHLKNSDVYKPALMDRKLFSKVLSDKDYKPSKDTCMAILLSLGIDLDEAKKWLERAGHAINPSDRRDIILEYCIREHFTNVAGVNEVLFRLNEKTLGR